MRVFGPGGQGEGEGIGCVGTVHSLLTCEIARWALTWKEAEGKKTAKARLVATGYQDPDLRDGNIDTAVCVSRRSSWAERL